MADEDCVVCGQDAPVGTASDCHACGELFHLNERNDTEGKDCGAVWIDEQYLALRFACQNCLDAEEPSPKPEVRTPRVGKRRYRRRDL